MKKIITLLLILIMTSVSVFATGNYEILTDADFEEADDEVWVKYVKAFIDFSDDAYEGSYALLSSERTHSTDVVRQFVQDELNYYGQGKYTAQAQVKLAEADAEPIEFQLVIGIHTEEKAAYITSGYTTVSGSEWTQISLTKDFKWDGEVTSAEFYFVTKENEDTGYADILIDNCSLVPLEFTGEPYEEIEETPAPTQKPTEKPAEEEKPQETEKPEETETATPTPVVIENSGPNKKQSQVIGGMIIACGVILLIGAVALFISYRKDKKNEKAQ